MKKVVKKYVKSAEVTKMWGKEKEMDESIMKEDEQSKFNREEKDKRYKEKSWRKKVRVGKSRI